MSQPSVTSVGFRTKFSPEVRGTKLVSALSKSEWSISRTNFIVGESHGVSIPRFSFEANYKSNTFHFTFFENEMSIFSDQNVELKQLVDMFYFLIDLFDEETTFSIGCWISTLEDYSREVGKKKKLDYFGSFAGSFDFETMLKVPPSFFYVNYSLISNDELAAFKKKYRFKTEMKHGIIFFDNRFYECMQDGMVIGRGSEKKRV